MPDRRPGHSVGCSFGPVGAALKENATGRLRSGKRRISGSAVEFTVYFFPNCDYRTGSLEPDLLAASIGSNESSDVSTPSIRRLDPAAGVSPNALDSLISSRRTGL